MEACASFLSQMSPSLHRHNNYSDLVFTFHFPSGTSGKEPANAGDTRDEGVIPGSGRSPEVGNSNPLQYSCLENPRDRGAWRATVHEVTKSQTRLKQISIHAFHTYVYVIACMHACMLSCSVIFNSL